MYTLFTSSSEAGIDSDPPESVTIGTALSPTPKVVVISRRGSPVAGKQVLMYVGESPVFFSTTTVVQSNRVRSSPRLRSSSLPLVTRRALVLWLTGFRSPCSRLPRRRMHAPSSEGSNSLP